MLSSADHSAIQAVLTGFNDAWNRHDMDAFASFLADDCEWINVVGMHWNGKGQVVKAHRAFHATMFKDVSIHTLESEIGWVAPGVALAVVTSKADDYTTPSGQRMTNILDRLSLVLVKRDGRWLIRAGHNTTIDQAAARHDPSK